MNGTRDPTIPRWQRSLLPAALLGVQPTEDGVPGVAPRRSARDWLVDICIFGLAAMIGAAQLVSNWRHVGAGLATVDVVLGIAACLSLWVRRRYPLAVGLAAVGASAFSGLAGGAAIAGVFTVAVHRPPRRTAQLAGLAILAAAVYSLLYRGRHTHPWSGMIADVLAIAVAVGYGLYVHAQRELVHSLHDRSRRLQDEQHLRVREAQLAERTRIAREMHDVLAHRISLLSVHAGALEFNPDASREDIARAAGVIRMSARAAQEELRAVIGVLREDADGATVAPPQPTLVDLDELVAESRRAGMDVEARLELDVDGLPERLGRTVYRLVQEALTNARKHAPGQRVAIAIAADQDTGVSVEVVNRPLVGQAVGPSTAMHGAGAGLIGLTERVALAGGLLSHEVLGDGGFVVRATLPWQER